MVVPCINHIILIISFVWQRSFNFWKQIACKHGATYLRKIQYLKQAGNTPLSSSHALYLHRLIIRRIQQTLKTSLLAKSGKFQRQDMLTVWSYDTRTSTNNRQNDENQSHREHHEWHTVTEHSHLELYCKTLRCALDTTLHHSSHSSCTIMKHNHNAMC